MDSIMNEFDKYSKLLNLIGYALAKFDIEFVKEFGFGTKTAFYRYCVELGIAKTLKAVSNRQDSFDPYFDNGRKGWHQRNQREHIKLFIDSLFGKESAKDFANIIKQYLKELHKPIADIINASPITTSRFKQLQETGKEAEFYFMQNYQNITIFKNAVLEDARLWGDGYDFQIKLKEKYALVEVKGLQNKIGSIRITQNEFQKAKEYQEYYFLIIVSNLIATPKMNCISNPIKKLEFTQREIQTTQINYHTKTLEWK
ncbi:DUF3883 domain-containing protein [Helicobacter winghamensis]